MAWYDDPNQTHTIREYGSRAAMEKEVRKAADHGWDVVSTAPKTRRGSEKEGPTWDGPGW